MGIRLEGICAVCRARHAAGRTCGKQRNQCSSVHVESPETKLAVTMRAVPASLCACPRGVIDARTRRAHVEWDSPANQLFVAPRKGFAGRGLTLPQVPAGLRGARAPSSEIR